MTASGNNLTVRQAADSDIDSVMAAIDSAREIMRVTGNLTQWADGYPPRHVLANDIAKGHCFIIETREGATAGCFSFIPGPDPTYASIDGEWTNHGPYSVIHRLASSGITRGVAGAALEFCRARCEIIRIDTHADNRPMLNWLRKEGFVHCGVITIADGTPREAFLLECNQRPTTVE